MPNEKVNKTTAIKDYLRAHPGAKNKEVADALTKSGIKMTPNYVATIKSKLFCENTGDDRVRIVGHAVLYAKGELHL